MQKAKDPRGGANRGQGRKSQWVTEDKSVRVTFQLPTSKADEIKAEIEKLLKPYKKMGQNQDKTQWQTVNTSNTENTRGMQPTESKDLYKVMTKGKEPVKVVGKNKDKV